jgi:hypothetical protein
VTQARSALICLALTAVLGLTSAAWAGPDSDSAKASLKKAYGDYYRAYRSSPEKGEAASRRLSKSILAPTQKRFNDATAQEARARATQVSRDGNAERVAKSRLQKKIASRKSNELLGIKLANKDKGPPSGDSRAQAQSPSSPAPRTSTPSRGSSRRQTVLDGSRVPRELEFK